MQLETERLILRNYNENDIDAYWEYVSQERVGPMCGWPTYTDKERAKERLQIEIAKPYQFAIFHKKAGKVIGSVELMDFKNERFPDMKNVEVKEIGFLLNENFWGQGIMPEATGAVVDFAFSKLNVQEIVISHAEANLQSGRVQEKLGFKIFGRLPNYRVWLDGKQTDLIQRKMTKQEWENKKTKEK